VPPGPDALAMPAAVNASIRRKPSKEPMRYNFPKAGGYPAYYTCYEVKIDHSDFYTGNTNPIDATSKEVVVACIPELGYSTEPMLIAGDYLFGFTGKDDEGAPVNIAWPDPARIVRGAYTQEAAQGDQYISVKLLTDAGSQTGNAFDAEFKFTDGASAANTCLPRIQASKWVQVTKMNGDWYVVNPTLIDSESCT